MAIGLLVHLIAIFYFSTIIIIIDLFISSYYDQTGGQEREGKRVNRRRKIEDRDRKDTENLLVTC